MSIPHQREAEHPDSWTPAWEAATQTALPGTLEMRCPPQTPYIRCHVPGAAEKKTIVNGKAGGL